MTKWEQTVRTYEGQQFETLRNECREKNQLFQDPIFPAELESLSSNYRQTISSWKEIVWRRPGQIVENPQLIVNGIKRTDPNQGELGNCWFVAAMSALTQNSIVLRHVIPVDQSFDPNWYAGIFHFRFWRFQQWFDIVIDDRLPYLNKQKRLWGAKNHFEINEFWVSLLEKAYAKLNGSYANLAGGLPVNALTDFTGGIEQRFEFKSNHSITHLRPSDLFDFIKSCLDYGSLIACSINGEQHRNETILPNGLVVGHTYSITNYHILSANHPQSKSTKLSDRGLIRFRNPWGNEIEWNGTWSDFDPIWNSLDEKTRQRLSFQRHHDGEFWMSFNDFYKEFDVMEVCHISPDTYDEFGLSQQDSKHQWRMWFAVGSWRKGENSGGSCANAGCRHGCYYWRNPQFVIELTVNRSHNNSNRLCMMIIALMQKPLTNSSSNEQYIQIRLFRIKPHVKMFEKKIYQPDEVERIASTGPYVNRREVSLLLKTTTGAYLIIPSMADVDENSDFLLRVFSQDTTVGRTFVNIFAHDHQEDFSRRVLHQQYTISESTPMEILLQTTKSKDTSEFDEERINVIPIRPTPETFVVQRSLATFFLLNKQCFEQTNQQTLASILISIYKLLIFIQICFYSSQSSSILSLPDLHRSSQNNIECHPVDIQLYTWSGEDFQSGECWYQGHRFAHGTTWGRTDLSGSPYCVCEQGHVRIFYSSQSASVNRVADALTLIRPINGVLPNANDLVKWPIHNFTTVRQRIVICSFNRIGLRIRSRDGCVACKCSKNGHWLCRRAPPKNFSTCPIENRSKFCYLIEHLLSSNVTKNFSRYIEIPRQTSWVDMNITTRCSCSIDGYLNCIPTLNSQSSRPCLVHKSIHYSISYYFPSGSTWMTPSKDQCRTCQCVDGERRCLNCHPILNIKIETNLAEIGEYRHQLSTLAPRRIRPCLLELETNSHRLIYPGQQTWWQGKCYFCSLYQAHLLRC